MKLSVVIPVYNEENYLPCCLDALSKQTVQPDEILVVDNNSTDKSVRIAKKYGARIVHESRQGMIFSRNRGFDEARGEIVARCDADCIPPPTWIEIIKKNFEESNLDALTGPFTTFDAPPFLGTFFSLIFFTFMRVVQRGNTTLAGPNMCLTKNIWNTVREKVCLDDKKVHEDVDLGIHLHSVNAQVRFDKNLVMITSSRRVQTNPASFFFEYPVRLIKTIRHHTN